MFDKRKKGDVLQYIASSEQPPIDQLKELPAGIYEPRIINGFFGESIIFTEKENPKETYVTPSVGIHNRILTDVSDYFTPEVADVHQKLGMSQKLGLIIEGPHCTGKTVLAEILGRKMAKEKGAVVIWCDSGTEVSDISTFIREIQKRKSNQLVVVMYDEVEWLVGNDETAMLTFLDGIDSPENFVFLGITNYIKNIPDRIKHRKSRIKTIYTMDKLDKEVYQQYVEEKVAPLNYDDKKIRKIVQTMSNQKMSMDNAKHYLIDSVISELG